MAEHYDEEVVRSRTEKEKLEKRDEVEQALRELISLHEDVVEKPEVDDELSKLRGIASEQNND